MPPSLYVELESEALAVVRALMPVFGTSDIAGTMAQALGLAKATSRYVEDGFLTVVDPGSVKPELEEALINIDVRYEPSAGTSSQAA